MSSAFRGLRAIRRAKLLASIVSKQQRPVIAQVGKFSTQPAKQTVKPMSKIIAAAMKSGPVAKPYPFITKAIQAGGMPQLVPFYFVNQAFFAFAMLTTIIYMSSKYVLPRFVRLFLSRTFITKL